MKKLLTLSALVATGVTQTMTASDLIAYWSFDKIADGYAVDERAGNVGVLLNGPQFTNEGTGRSGSGTDRAMLFGNGQHRLVVSDASFLDATGANNAISISFWQNLSQIRNQFTFWADSETVPRALSLTSPWSDNAVYWDTGGGFVEGVSRLTAFPAETWLSKWVHVVVTKSGDTKRIYVNGIEEVNGLNTAILPVDFSEFVIGNNSGSFTEALNGTLDEIAIFSRELTPEEVTGLSNGDSPNSLVGSNDTDSDGLPDDWETRVAGDLTTLEAGGDPDNDSLTNEEEFTGGTNPTNDDTDGDGALDGEETRTGIWNSSSDRGTDPLRVDTDGDGIPDGAETNTGAFIDETDTGSDPHSLDSDMDGFSDGAEVIFASSNPNSETSIPLRPGQLDLLAYWDFNDDSDPIATFDQVKGFRGDLKPGTVFSADATGRTLTAGDRAIDMGATGNIGTGVIVEQGGFLDLAGAQDQIGVSFWVNLPSLQNSMAVYANSPSVERAFSAHAPWSNGQVYWDTNGCCDGARQRTYIAANLTLNSWSHVVLNKNEDTKAIWVNGVKLIENENTDDLQQTFTRFFIGTDSASLNTIGLIDDMAIYADALTDAEIGMLFAGTPPNSPSLVPPNSDTDGDGMQDAYEDDNGLDKTVDDRLSDLDDDGVNNITEFLNGTLPNDEDSDDDSLLDGVEDNTGVWVSATQTGTDPLSPDSDGDQLGDEVESNTGTFVSLTDTGTDPNLADTDGDRWNDFDEINWPTNANDREEFPSIDPGKLNLLAFWDFNDNSNPDTAVDCVRGFEANFFGADTGFSEDALGRTETAGDLAMNLGPNGVSNGAHVERAQWFGLGVPRGQIIENLGSAGVSSEMNVGAGVLGATGALAGDANSALTTTAPNNGTRTNFDPALNIDGPWSAEVWLKPSTTMAAGALTCAIANGDFAAPRKGWLIYQSDSGWNFRTYYNDGLATAVNINGNNGAPPVAGEWTHLVATWDGTVGKLYVDGVLRETSIPQTYVPGIAGGFTLGARSDGAFQWSGDVDEVAFYGTELTAAQVQEHYDNAVNPAPAVSYDSLIQSRSPIGYWRMESDDPEPGPDQVSISFWQKLDSVASSSAFWASSASSGGNFRGFQAHNPWGDGNYYFDTGGTAADTQRISGFSEVAAGQWDHFVYQKQGPVKEVWRNGVKVLFGELAAPLPNDFFRLTIGAEYREGPAGWNATRGLIDDFAVFGSFLGEEEIIRLANGESPKTISGPATPLEITSIELSDTDLTLTWNSRAGAIYSLESSLGLLAPWTELTDNISSQGETTTFVIPTNFIPDFGPKLFFRVFEQE